MTAAAKALGVNVTTIYAAVERGCTDNVGLYRTQGKPRPVVYEGVEYPSQVAAAKATGHPLTTVYGRLRKPWRPRRKSRKKETSE